VEHEVCRRRALGQFALETNADDSGSFIVMGWPSIAGQLDDDTVRQIMGETAADLFGFA